MVDINRTSYGLQLPTSVATEIMGSAREQSLVMRKGRRRDLVGGVSAIGATAGVTGSKFVAETARKPVGVASVSEKILRAYKIALVLSFSTEFVRDRAALYRALVEDMPKDLAATLDKAFLTGAGAPVGDFDTLADAPSQAIGDNPYTSLVTALGTSAAAGGSVTEFDFAPQGEASLFALATDGRPLLAPSTQAGTVGSILGRPVEISKNVHDEATNTIGFAMDWDSVFWGMVEGIKYRETDSPIYGDDGALIHAGAQDNMTSIICEVEVGVRTIDVNRHAASPARLPDHGPRQGDQPSDRRGRGGQG